jgi:phospholipid/cholesterol/gamma-HCH transport system substrate-binding protein
MEPHARYTVVGASVLILSVIVAAVLAWLLASGNARHVRHYTLTFTHQSLEGVEVNGEVHMKGIRVGSVTRAGFSKQGGVEVGIDVDAAAPVRTSTRAIVDRNLITGIATIRLESQQDDSPLLDAAQTSIPEGESQLQQFSQTASQLAQRADETMKRVGDALSPQNQAAFAETLQNLRVASRKADALAARADATLASIDRAAAALQSTATVATSDVHRLADRYDNLGAQAGDFLGDASIELRMTGEQVRSAADVIGTTSKKLGNPRAAIFGPPASSLGPGEIKR